jgi:hypothetical protein
MLKKRINKCGSDAYNKAVEMQHCRHARDDEADSDNGDDPRKVIALASHLVIDYAHQGKADS